jgi:hypothetical protein
MTLGEARASSQVDARHLHHDRQRMSHHNGELETGHQPVTKSVQVKIFKNIQYLVVVCRDIREGN